MSRSKPMARAMAGKTYRANPLLAGLVRHLKGRQAEAHDVAYGDRLGETAVKLDEALQQIYVASQVDQQLSGLSRRSPRLK